jgi:hypothetical protein
LYPSNVHGRFSRHYAAASVDFGDGCQGLIFDEKMTILPVDHHGGHKVGPIVFILGENIAKCKDMSYGRSSAEIVNSKWPPRGFIRLIFN